VLNNPADGQATDIQRSGRGIAAALRAPASWRVGGTRLDGSHLKLWLGGGYLSLKVRSTYDPNCERQRYDEHSGECQRCLLYRSQLSRDARIQNCVNSFFEISPRNSSDARERRLDEQLADAKDRLGVNARLAPEAQYAFITGKLPLFKHSRADPP